MQVRRWKTRGVTWVEVAASTKEEHGMPAVLVQCAGDGRQETADLTAAWDVAVEGRRKIDAELKALRVNARRGKS